MRSVRLPGVATCRQKRSKVAYHIAIDAQQTQRAGGPGPVL